MSKAQELSSVFDAAQSISFAAGEGIDFGAEVLDDYEEGTWTPVFDEDTGFSATAVTNYETYYTKIGRLVNIYGEITVNGTNSAINAGDAVQITGFPYSPETPFNENVSFLGKGLIYEGLGDNQWADVSLLHATSTGTIFIEVIQTSGSVPANSAILFSCTYQAN